MSTSVSTKQAADWSSLRSALAEASGLQRIAVAQRIARQVAQLRGDGALPDAVRSLRIGVLRAVTAEPLGAPLVAALAEQDFAAQVEFGQLGNVAPEILADDSFLYRGRFDAALVLADAARVAPELIDAARTHLPDARVGDFVRQVEHLAQRFDGLVIACNFVPAPDTPAPLLASQSPTGGRYRLEEANRRLAELAAKHANLVVADLARVAAEIGLRNFWSLRDMAASMQPLQPEAMLAVADEVARLCALYWRAAVKCIVLDCDNTLWGGIIGEDGMNGIRLGESYPGVCFAAFQRHLQQLTELGFLLAINSKNNEADVREVFDRHPGAVLKWEQFASRRINWQDKVANMRAIAQELNIGLDSLLFIDDSDFEINLIREQLPQVRCVQASREPWALPGVLRRVPGLDRLRVTSEDRAKARMYADEAQRRDFKSQAADIETYLKGLKIKLLFERFDPGQHLARVAQMTQKTNQFNLTTVRMSEADVRAAQENGMHIFVGSVADRFGDYGRVVLAMVRPVDEKTCDLHLFLMSCRVIGRGVEQSFLRLAQQAMRDAGFETMTAAFITTAKNAVSRDFLSSCDFVEVGRDGDARVDYTYDLRSGIAETADWLEVTQRD